MRKEEKHKECLQDKCTHTSPQVRSDPSHFIGVGFHEKIEDFLCQKLIRESMRLFKGKNDVAAQCSRHW